MQSILNKKIFWVVFFLLIFSPALLWAEYIFLKDGKIIKGSITDDLPGAVVARVAGKRKRIRRSNIVRILYTELKMGKVYIRKRDGTKVIAFIVDEDRESYTCRKVLFSPEEFRLMRSDVLFIAEKNPSGLKGEAGFTEAELSWFPPYERVKVYNVYAKTHKKDEYKKIASTSGKHISVKRLKSNTEYYFIVKSVDSEDYESFPSNEFKLKTKNIPPLPPDDTDIKKDAGGNYLITWSKGRDPDGTVKEYKLYRELNFKTLLLTTTSKRTYRVTKDVKFDSLYIKSTDNLNTESEEVARVYVSHHPEINLAVSPAYVLPFGNLKDVVGPGYGGTFRFQVSNYFFTGLDLGIESSFVKFRGREDISEIPENEVVDIILAPVQFFAGYSFYPFMKFRISPAVYGGACYVRERHTYFDIPTSSKKMKTSDGFEPLFGAGLSIRLDVSFLFFALFGDYRYVREKSGGISYFSISPSVGIRF